MKIVRGSSVFAICMVLGYSLDRMQRGRRKTFNIDMDRMKRAKQT